MSSVTAVGTNCLGVFAAWQQAAGDLLLLVIIDPIVLYSPFFYLSSASLITPLKVIEITNE